MVFNVEGSPNVFKPLALLNAYAGISVTPSGIAILVNFEQPEKMLLPADSQLFGKLMLLRFVQFSKAYDPIMVTLSGKVTAVKPVQS